MPDDPEPPRTPAQSRSDPSELPTEVPASPSEHHPSDPWPHAEATVLALSSPSSPSSPPGRFGWRRAPRWLPAVGAATVVLAVTMFFAVLFWPAGAAGPLDFHPLEPVRTITFGTGTEHLAAGVFGDQVYVGTRRDGGVAVAASALASGGERWERPLRNVTELDSLSVVSDVVLVFGADGVQTTTSSVLVVLDAGTGEELWRHGYGNDQDWLLGGDVMTLVDRESGAMRGLDPRSRDQLWSVPLPDANTVVRPVIVDDDMTGRSRLADLYDLPRQGDQVVLVGSDRSVQLVDTDTGDVSRGANIADPQDQLLAYEDRLFIANLTEGRIYSHDLNDLAAQPQILYTAQDPGWSPSRLVPCGEERLCLIEGSGEETTVTSLDTGGDGVAWSHPLPAAATLLPVGEWLVVGTNAPAVVAFDRDGGELLRRPGVAVRINAANILLVSGSGSFATDLNVAGVSFGSGSVERTELGQIAQVRPDGCAWDEQHLICPASEGTDIWQFALG